MTSLLARTVALVAAAVLVSPSAALAKTEIQWWHAMTAVLGERVNEIATKFNASQNDYEVKAVYKGSYPDTLNAAIAAYRAKQPPHRPARVRVAARAAGVVAMMDHQDGNADAVERHVLQRLTHLAAGGHDARREHDAVRPALAEPRRDGGGRHAAHAGADEPHRRVGLGAQRGDERPHVGRVLGAGAEADERLARPIGGHVDDRDEQAVLGEALPCAHEEVRVARTERTALQA